MASLRRAIETAGAESSITSLWSVPSAKTTELMTSFYGYLAEGYGKRAALRKAKLAAITTDPNPYNWAGFVFAGKDVDRLPSV
jgi:CHAT domain-containing protein